MKLRMVSVRLMLLSALVLPASSHAYFWTLRTTSEGDRPLTCPQNHLVTGIRCLNGHCGDIRLECSGNDAVVSEHKTVFREWKAHISEEKPNVATCRIEEPYKYEGSQNGFFGVITGIACKGKNCDDLSLECAGILDNGPSMDSCYWTDWVSEEDGGTLLFPEGDFAVNMQCRGNYCDDKRFLLCGLRF